MTYEPSDEDYEKYDERFETYFLPFKTGDITKIKEMIALGFDLNAALLQPDDMYINTPLSVAGVNGQLETVKFLIEHGANPRLKIHCDYGYGLLDYVGLLIELVVHDKLDVLKYLVENGAAEDINNPISPEYVTLLDAASRKTYEDYPDHPKRDIVNHPEIKEYLESIGAKTGVQMNYIESLEECPELYHKVLQPGMIPYTGWKNPYNG